MLNKNDKTNYIIYGMTFGSMFGVVIGIIVGLFLNNIPICLIFGVALGNGLGLTIGGLLQVKSDKQE